MAGFCANIEGGTGTGGGLGAPFPELRRGRRSFHRAGLGHTGDSVEAGGFLKGRLVLQFERVTAVADELADGAREAHASTRRSRT